MEEEKDTMDEESSDQESEEQTEDSGEESSPDNRLAELEAENKKLYARAKKAEERLKTSGTEEEKPSAEPTAPAPSPDFEKRIDLKVDLRMAGFTQGEINEMETYAKGQGKSLADVVAQDDVGKWTVKNPFLRAGIEGIREKAKVEEATPPPSSRSPKVGGKSWAEMSDKERKANWGSFKDQVGKSGATSHE